MPEYSFKFTPNEKASPPGKLADAEIHFSGDDIFADTKWVGYAIWERRSGNGRNVTFPSRQYSVNGERRSYALHRPIGDSKATEKVRDAILSAYELFEAEQLTRD